jgi:hypothetical protein
MKYFLILLLTTSYFHLTYSQNQVPVLDIQEVLLDEENKVITINYDVEDAEGDELEIFLLASDDDGASFHIPTTTATGDIGFPITSGTNKQITWSYDGQLGVAGNYQIKLVADDRQTVDIEDLVAQVDSNQIKSRLENIVGIRHYITNNVNLNRCRDTIEQSFIQYGLQTFRQNFPYSNTTGQNIIGTQQGVTQDATVLIIDGHYDTVSDSPGADDNGTAVIGVLEAARILSQYRFHKSIRFIGFDLEEAGLRGSIYYVDHLSEDEEIEGVLNLEMIGYYTEEPNTQTLPAGFEVIFPEASAQVAADENRGNFITNTSVESFNVLSDAFHNAASTYVPDLRVIDVAIPDGLIIPDLLRSDHAPFWGEDIPALMLTDGADFRNPFYHTPNDQINTINFTFMQQVIQTVIAATAEQAQLSHSTEAIASVQITVGEEHLHELACPYSISPIPSNDNLHLRFGNCQEQTLQVQLISLDGRVHINRDVIPQQGLTTLDTSLLPKGIYWLRLSDGVHYSSHKVILQ